MPPGARSPPGRTRGRTRGRSRCLPSAAETSNPGACAATPGIRSRPAPGPRSPMPGLPAPGRTAAPASNRSFGRRRHRPSRGRSGFFATPHTVGSPGSGRWRRPAARAGRIRSDRSPWWTCRASKSPRCHPRRHPPGRVVSAAGIPCRPDPHPTHPALVRGWRCARHRRRIRRTRSRPAPAGPGRRPRTPGPAAPCRRRRTPRSRPGAGRWPG